VDEDGRRRLAAIIVNMNEYQNIDKLVSSMRETFEKYPCVVITATQMSRLDKFTKEKLYIGPIFIDYVGILK
jgi:hypothetical protein